MAPEYVVRGKLSEKADVYSFGVLVIEVITGKRNNAISQNSFSLLQKVFHFSHIINIHDLISFRIPHYYS